MFSRSWNAQLPSVFLVLSLALYGAFSRHLAAGGRLYMLKARSVALANLGASYANGTTFDVEWVQILAPDNPSPATP